MLPPIVLRIQSGMSEAEIDTSSQQSSQHLLSMSHFTSTIFAFKAIGSTVSAVVNGNIARSMYFSGFFEGFVINYF